MQSGNTLLRGPGSLPGITFTRSPQLGKAWTVQGPSLVELLRLWGERETPVAGTLKDRAVLATGRHPAKNLPSPLGSALCDCVPPTEESGRFIPARLLHRCRHQTNWLSDWREEVFLSPGSTGSVGVAFLFADGLALQAVVPGRLLMGQATFEQYRLFLINV